jgi:hexulose-6-phosphate isomerase
VKKAISMWAFPPEMDVASRIRRAGELGFEGFELCLGRRGEFSLESADADVIALKRVADSAGVALGTVCSGLFFQYSLTSSRPEIREGAMAVVRKEIDCAALLGAEVALVVPGIVGCDFLPREVVPDAVEGEYFAGGEVIDYDVAWERSLAALAELAKHAAEKGVAIGVENIWGRFLLSPMEMRNFIDAVGSSWVRAYLDVGNCMLLGYPQHWIKILGPRLVAVHAKDFRRGTARLEGFVDLLAGDVDWRAVYDTLVAAGFSGWVTAESTPVYKQYPELTAAAASVALDCILRKNRKE